MSPGKVGTGTEYQYTVNWHPAGFSKITKFQRNGLLNCIIYPSYTYTHNIPYNTIRGVFPDYCTGTGIPGQERNKTAEVWISGIRKVVHPQSPTQPTGIQSQLIPATVTSRPVQFNTVSSNILLMFKRIPTLVWGHIVWGYTETIF